MTNESNIDPTKHPKLGDSVEKLAMAGQQAGFSVEQMIELLKSGMTVDTLLDLLVWRLNAMTRGLELSGIEQKSSSLKAS